MRRLPVKDKLAGPVLIALAIHACLFALLFVSYTKEPELPESRPVVKARLYQLESQNRAEKSTAQKIAGDAEKTAAKQHESEQLEQQKRQQQAAQRKQEQERQQAAARAAEAKRKQEQQAAEAKKLAEQKAAAARKQREQEQAQQKKREAELAAKKAAEEQQRAREQAKRQAEEAERRRAEEAKQAAALAELLAEQTRYQREQADRQTQEEIGRLHDLITDLISSNWIRPAGTRNGMEVELVVEFLADGRITNVRINKSSGYAAYDNSAVAAIRSVGRVREIQNLEHAVYERSFRQLRMAFKPEDLGL